MAREGYKTISIPEWLYDALGKLSHSNQSKTGVIIDMFNKLYNPPRDDTGHYTQDTIIIKLPKEK